MKVLVFDSSLDRAKLIRDLLEDYKYKTIIHQNGGQVLSGIRDLKPSLIIVHSKDHGIQILEKIKKDSHYSKIPVIMISSLYSQEVIDRIKNYPNVDFLVEPFKIKNFRHVVERWINFRSLYVS
jgi:twitching motility two-component system response regulator PilG